MNLKKIFYAALIGISISCAKDGSDKHEKDRKYCQERLVEVVKISKIVNSEELNSLLLKKWCEVKKDYWQDGEDLVKITERSANDFCYEKRSEASKVISKNEDLLEQMVFEKNFNCDNERYQHNLHEGRSLQRLMDSYNK